MSRLAHLNHLREQESEVRFLIERATHDGDVVAEMNFQSRLEEISNELDNLERVDANVAEIALMFDGRPVHGKASIDAKFATKALSIFQDLLSKMYASTTHFGLEGARGKIRGQTSSALRITELARGSFGFVLEEASADQHSSIPSAMREALDQTTATFSDLTQSDDDNFLLELDAINPRVFKSLKEFFNHLHSNEATLKTSLPDRTIAFGEEAVKRGHERLSLSKIEVDEKNWVGKLVGLTPISRSFEFLRDGALNAISGKFGEEISQDYLERIETEGITLGADKKYAAHIEIITVQKPTGEISVSYTALSLEELEQ